LNLYLNYMIEDSEYCDNCGNKIQECKCEEHTKQKWLFIFGISSIVIGILGFVVAFLI